MVMSAQLIVFLVSLLLVVFGRANAIDRLAAGLDPLISSIHGEETATDLAASSPDSRPNETNKRITTIIVDSDEGIVSITNRRKQEDSTSSQEFGPVATTKALPLSDQDVNQSADSRARSTDLLNKTIQVINSTSKIIFIMGEADEIGYLYGETKSGGQNSSKTRGQRSRELPKDWFKSRQMGLLDGDTNNSQTNYSVYLISRHKAHIALLLDIVDIDFEPMINCENQEIKFSVVSELSESLSHSSLRFREESLSSNDWVNNQEDLLDTGSSLHSGSSSSRADGDDNNDNNNNDKDRADEGDDLESQQGFSVTTSEAMAYLLNSPLNVSILDDSSEPNDFAIFDAAMDRLYDETCLEMRLASSSLAAKIIVQQDDEPKPASGGKHKNRSAASGGKRRSSYKRGLNRRRHSKKRIKKQQRACPSQSEQFKSSMSAKLDKAFDWDDFKIVCGKTRQLIIPTRSAKISVFSDEFSADSHFKIRYQFVSDPSLLPNIDNGKFYCRNRNIIDLELRCDGYDDCGDASDESTKICGFPSGRPLEAAAISRTRQGISGSLASGAAHPASTLAKRKRLTYVDGNLLNCCQSSEWLSFMTRDNVNEANNLQSIIGQSMNIFAGSVIAPTRGHLKRSKRIVGGAEANRGAWPSQVSLQYEVLEPLSHFCAGTLIHPQYVITAGHCITKDSLARGIKAVFGAHDLRQVEAGHVQSRYVDDALVFPGVNVKHLSFDWENDMNNDIALLRLSAPVLVGPHIAPACLPPFDTPLAVNTTCRSVGWGQTQGSGGSNVLKHLQLRVVNGSMCSDEIFEVRDRDRSGKQRPSLGDPSKKLSDRDSVVSLDQYSDKTMVCVKNDRGHGICQGDSGGPLYCERENHKGELCNEIYGIASFIIQYATVSALCAVENLPGFFGEVSSKTEWIKSSIKMFEQTYKLKYSLGLKT